MCKFYFHCKTETALRQQRWVDDSGYMEQLEKMGWNSPAVLTAHLERPFLVHLDENSHFQQLPMDIIYLPTFESQKVTTLTFQSGISWTEIAAHVPCGVWAACLTHPRQQQGNAVWSLSERSFFSLGFLQQPKCSLTSRGWKSSGDWRWHINVEILVMLSVIELANASLESSP